MTLRRIAVILNIALLVLVLVLALVPGLALAGPGGAIAKAVAKSFWAKAALVALTVFFLPIISWVLLKEWRAERRALKVLERLVTIDAAFHPMRLRDRIREAFPRVHSAWSKDQIAEASAVMTDWYWQNQELAHLRRWESEGLENHCSVKSDGRIRPLHVKGDKEFKDIDSVWTFQLVDGVLKVAQIEESYLSLTYAGQPNVLIGLAEEAAPRRA